MKNTLFYYLQTLAYILAETCIVPAKVRHRIMPILAPYKPPYKLPYNSPPSLEVRITVRTDTIFVNDLGFFALQHVDGNTGVASPVDCC